MKPKTEKQKLVATTIYLPEGMRYDVQLRLAQLRDRPELSRLVRRLIRGWLRQTERKLKENEK